MDGRYLDHQKKESEKACASCDKMTCGHKRECSGKSNSSMQPWLHMQPDVAELQKEVSKLKKVVKALVEFHQANDEAYEKLLKILKY